MQAPPTLLYFDDEQGAALGLAQAAGLVPAPVQRHRFPDGEIRLRLPDALPERVVLLRTLDHPNEKLVDLLLAARTARLLGARHLTLVAPYLAYMRQDIAFVPGEAISQRIVGRFLAELFDAVVTVDPHLHRVATLQEAVPVGQAVVLSGAPLLADLIAQRRPGALLVGPDSESAQWVSQAAARHGVHIDVGILANDAIYLIYRRDSPDTRAYRSFSYSSALHYLAAGKAAMTCSSRSRARSASTVAGGAYS